MINYITTRKAKFAEYENSDIHSILYVSLFVDNKLDGFYYAESINRHAFSSRKIENVELIAPNMIEEL